LRSFNANLLGVALNMVNLTSRRHHKDPSASNKAYSKYYTMNTRSKLFGGGKGKLPPVRENPMNRPATLPKAANTNPAPGAKPQETVGQEGWTGSSQSK